MGITEEQENRQIVALEQQIRVLSAVNDSLQNKIKNLEKKIPSAGRTWKRLGYGYCYVGTGIDDFLCGEVRVTKELHETHEVIIFARELV